MDGSLRRYGRAATARPWMRMGPRYSMTKTVLQAIWRPSVILVYDQRSNRFEEWDARRHTEILDEHFACLSNILVLGNHSLAVLERLPRRRVEQTDAVVVVDASLLGNQLLDIFDRGTGGEVD
jgi:hypothetical protein